MTKIERGLALCAAIAATGVEVYAVYDGLKNATGAQLAMGILFAVLTPLAAAFMRGALKWFGILVFVVLLAGVIVNGGSRVGSAIDRVQDQRAQASRASQVAAETAGELKGILEEARATAKKACADGKERTSPCTKANGRVDDLVNKWSDAGSKLSVAPVVAGNGDVARISAWLGGYVTDRQVSLYLPLLLPVGTALAGAFFWAAWGYGRPTKTAPVPTPAIPTPVQAEILAPARPQLVSDHVPAYSVADYVAERIVATKGNRLAFSDVYGDYTSIAQYRGLPILETEQWKASLAKLCEGTPVYTRELAGQTYIINVRFIKAKRLGNAGRSKRVKP